MDRFAPRVKLLDYGLFSFYSKRDIPNKVKITNRKEFNKIVKYIFKIAANNLVSRSGGVVLDNIGYFTHWVTPKKRVFKSPRKGGYVLNTNYHTNSYFYNTSMFTSVFKQNNLKGWSMDKAFNSNIKSGMFNEMKSGKKYKFYYSLMKNLFKNKEI